MSYALQVGEVVEVLSGFNDNSFDALMCDPPYGFRFMGKGWDYDVPSVALWRECLRVLKPGAPLLAFGGSRTYHRLACGVEDAGFELRDQLLWLYGKGFPKSQDVSKAIDKALGAERPIVGQGHRKATGRLAQGEGGYAFAEDYALTAPATELAQAWDGYGTALKPAFEPVVLARKPLDGTMAQNIARWGVGGLAIDACRIEGGAKPLRIPQGNVGDNIGSSFDMGRGKCAGYTDEGRWPANLLLDEEAAALLDASVAPTKSVPYPENAASGNVLPFTKRTAGGYSDSGGPSRFFYCSKVSTKEREAGCEGLPKKSAGETTDREDDSAGLDSPRTGAGRGGGARNFHPTLKPISLTTWLASLIKPPSGGVILVPFAGSGSEMIGCVKAGWSGVFGIEREEDYATIARARLAHWCGEPRSAAYCTRRGSRARDRIFA